MHGQPHIKFQVIVDISKKSNDIHVEIKNRGKIQTLVFLNVKHMFRLCTATFRSKDVGVEVF